MQDFLTSAFLVTGRDCFYTREAAAELVAAMCDALGSVDLPQPALLKPLQLWTGKQLMSALIRPSSRMQCAPHPSPACTWTGAVAGASSSQLSLAGSQHSWSLFCSRWMASILCISAYCD